MNSLTLLLVCVQVCLIQNIHAQGSRGKPMPPYNRPGPVFPPRGPVYPPQDFPCQPSGPSYPVPSSNVPASSISQITIPETCNFSLNGDNLLIDGTVEISGSIPFMSHVQLDGVVPCDGVASVQNSCNCGSSYVR